MIDGQFTLGVEEEYQIVHPETLWPVERAEPGSRVLLAAFAGTTRLIDNLGLP